MEDIKRNLAKTLIEIPKEQLLIFPTVAEMLGEVCSHVREIFERQLGLKPRKVCLLHVLWSVRIHFEQTTYTDVITFHYCRMLQEMARA
jgi:methylphosphotriester-DNA--protein-cysteine methyltransferase